MSISASETIKKAFAKAGVFEYTDTGISPKMGQLGLDYLNDILSEWSINEELNPGNQTYFFKPNNQAYIKISSDPNETGVDIPVQLAQILNLSAQYGESLTQPVFPMREISIPEYNQISVKQIPSIPEAWAWDQQAPTSYVYVFPQSNGSLWMRLIGIPLLAVTTATGQIPLPDSYRSGLAACLALRILNSFPRSDNLLHDALLAEMNAALRQIKERNRHARIPDVSYGFHGNGSSDRPNFWNSSWNNVVR